MLPVILAAVALLFAVLCAVIPASWFERAENPLDEVWQQVLEMLREEEGRLGEQGEDVLSDEMRDLIDGVVSQGYAVIWTEDGSLEWGGERP